MEDLFTRNATGVYNGIHRPTLYKIIREAGYRNLSEGGMLKDSILCKESSNKIDLAHLDDMWNYILSFAGTSGLKQNLLMKLRETMGDRIVKVLDRISYIPYKDDKNNCRLFFKNGVLQLNRITGSTDLIEWSNFKPRAGKVLSSNISEISFDDSLDINYRDGSFYKFCRNVVGADGLRPLMIALGYLIHSYKNPSNPFLIVFSEGGEFDNNKSSGGTGKSLILQNLIQCVRTQSWLDGKAFKGDSSFKMQNVSKYADNLLIDDLSQKFNYEDLYPSISNVMTIEQKNLTPIQIPYALSPKIAVTTNYGLIANSDSDVRRRRVIGVNNYYSSKLTPYDEFHHNFFDDWVDDRAVEWQYCFRFIIECVKAFFDNDCEVESHNHMIIETKALANAQNPDLMDFCIDNYHDFIGISNCKAHKEWDEVAFSIVGRTKMAGWKQFRAAMEAIGLTSSKGVQRKEGTVNIRKYYFEVSDYEKLRGILVHYGVKYDHEGNVLIKDEDTKIELIPDEFIKPKERKTKKKKKPDVPDF